MATSSASALDVPPRLPLILTVESRDWTTNKDARLVNGYAEKQYDGSYITFKRAGLTALAGSPPATSSGPYGTYTWVSQGHGTQLLQVYLAIGGNYTLFAGSTNVGSMGISSGGFAPNPYFETLNDTNQSAVIYNAASHVNVKLYTWNGTTLTNNTAALTASMTASGAPGIVFLDGTVYIMDVTGKVWGSNINDVTTWSATNVFQSSSSPETAVALAKHLVYVVLLKSYSTEFAYDAGNTIGSPLGGVPGMKLDFGLFDPGSLQNIVGNLVWVAQGRNSAPFVVMLENGRPSRISSPSIERALSVATFGGGMTSFQATLGGHNFYGLTINSVTYVLDLKEKLWYLWPQFNGVTGGTSTDLTVYNYSGAGVTVPTILAGPGYNGLLSFNPAVYQDTLLSGLKPISVDLYTPNFDGGSRRNKHLETMYFDADRVPALMSVSCNDWDYDPARWTAPRYVDLSSRRPYLERCGTFYRRAWHFNHTANTPFRLDGVDLAMSLGSK